MRHKSAWMLGAAIIVLSMGGIAGWFTLTQNSGKLLQSLTPPEHNCVEQIVSNGELVFIEPQAIDDSLAIGYLVNKDYYTSIFRIGSSGNCHIEFKVKAFGCYEEYQTEYCLNTKYKVEPQRIQKVKLTEDPVPEIYVWFDVRGLGVRSGAHHAFYIQQADGSNKPILKLKLCKGLSSLEFNSTTHMIHAVDDVVCDMFHGRKEHIDYLLVNEVPEKLNDWFDP